MPARLGGGGGTAANINRTIKKSTQRKPLTRDSVAPPAAFKGPREESYLSAVAGNRVTSTGARKTTSVRRRIEAPTASQRRALRVKLRFDADEDRRDGLTAAESRAYRNVETATGASARREPPVRDSLAPSTVNLSDYSVRTPLRRREAGSGPLGIGGFVRTLGHTLGGIAQAAYQDPVEANLKAIGTVVEGAKAVPQVLGLVGGLSTVPITKAAEAITGTQVTDSDEQTLGAAKDMGKGIAASYREKYGPSWRGDTGSGARLRKVIREEGPLPSVLDVATVVQPTSALLGKGARVGTFGGRAQTVATRPTAVRYGLNDEVVSVPQRRGAVGIGVREAHNVARRAAQKRAVKRADAGKAELPPHRALVRESGGTELAPVANARARRRQRFLVAEETNRRDIRIKQRLNKFVGGSEGLLHAQRLVEDPELRPLIGLVDQLGIRSSADVPNIVPVRLAQIERELEAARLVTERRSVGRDSDAGPGAPSAVADEGLLAHVDELAGDKTMLEALMENPQLADTPGLAEAATRHARIMDEAVGGREGLAAGRKAEARTARQGETLGIETAAQINAKAQRGHAVELGAARAREQAARAQRDQVQARVKRDLTKAAERVKVAQGRAAVPGKGQARRQASLATARADLERARKDASTELSEVSDIVRARTAERKATAAAPPRRLKETQEQYAARVDAAFAERGLAKPGYAPGHYASKDEEMIVQSSAGTRSSNRNALRHKNEGTTSRLGVQAFDPTVEKDLLVANIKRGAALEAEANILQRQGFYFNTKAEAEAFIRGLGGSAKTKTGEGGWALVSPTLTRKNTKGLVLPKEYTGRDRGDYIAEHGGVFAVPAPVLKELEALGKRPSTPATIARRLAHAPQTALLALSPSWFVFQRVNDLVGMAFGGSILQARQLHAARRELRREHPDAADLVEMFTGGSASRTQLNPYSGQHLGRAQRMVDENPRLRDAWNSDTPAYNLLGLSPRLVNSTVWLGKKAPTSLLRADAKITGAAREMQYIQNLQKFAAKADPEVKAVIRATGPMGHALKTADVDLISKLLTDAKYAKVREEAATALNRVMGDWHTFTAAERSVKDFAAFYGFLRYSTRMLLYTLPVDHPLVALTVAQLGSYSADYAKSIIGPDIPYGLGALYAKSGKVITDLTRANPLTGPLMNVDRPEKLFGIGTPLISIVMSGTFGINVGLSDSAEGYLSQITTDRNADDKSLSPSDRMQILLDQTMSLLSPYKALKGMDTRPQTGDSSLFNRQYTVPKTPEEKVKLDQKRVRAGKGGVDSMLADFFPLFFSDGRNWRNNGEFASKMERDARERKLDSKAKFEGAQTPLGRMKIEQGAVTAEITEQVGDVTADVDAVLKQIERELVAAGLK